MRTKKLDVTEKVRRKQHYLHDWSLMVLLQRKVLICSCTNCAK